MAFKKFTRTELSPSQSWIPKTAHPFNTPLPLQHPPPSTSSLQPLPPIFQPTTVLLSKRVLCYSRERETDEGSPCFMMRFEDASHDFILTSVRAPIHLLWTHVTWKLGVFFKSVPQVDNELMLHMGSGRRSYHANASWQKPYSGEAWKGPGGLVWQCGGCGGVSVLAD